MKVSEISLETVKDYCGISDDDSDNILAALMPAARSFISEYTGLNYDEIDAHDDMPIAYMVLVNDMFTNREYNSAQARQSTTLNPCVKTILDMHCKNQVVWSDGV